MLSYMLEVRLNIDPSETQRYTTALLTLHGLVALVVAPPIAHFADKTPKRKGPFLISLAASLAGTYLIAIASSGEVLSCRISQEELYCLPIHSLGALSRSRDTRGRWISLLDCGLCHLSR